MSYTVSRPAGFRYVDALEPNPLRVGGHKVVFIPVTYTSGHVYPEGTLLGLVTATGKVVPCVQTAADGSQTPYAIAPETVDTTASGPNGANDATGQAYAQGYFNYTAMNIDASWGATPDAQAAALVGPLRQLGIFIRGTVYSS